MQRSKLMPQQRRKAAAMGSSGEVRGRYVSAKCGIPGPPYSHEDCVTGPSPFAAGLPDEQTCQCSCHDEMRQQLRHLRELGFTSRQITQIWLAGPRYRGEQKGGGDGQQQ